MEPVIARGMRHSTPLQQRPAELLEDLRRSADVTAAKVDAVVQARPAKGTNGV
jgi:hypothetical protein